MGQDSSPVATGINSTNPYLLGSYAPVHLEGRHADLPVIGRIPRDLNGFYFRNGPNPRFPPKGRYHWFDGDSMIHALHFEDGRATYYNRWTLTEGLQAELQADRSLFSGLMEPDPSNPLGAIKDNANTDVLLHAGRLYALFYRCGKPYALDPRTLETLGPDTFGGRLPGLVSAHAKVDQHTGEMMFFDLTLKPPFMHYGVVDAQGQLSHHVPIPLPGPRFSHDMVITARHSILMDMPVFLDPEALAVGRQRMRFFREVPARFAILPRHGRTEEVRWFEAEPCYIYHSLNAWEEGDEIIMDVCRVTDPMPERQGETGLQRMVRVLAGTLDSARLYRYRFNLRTGATREQPLDDLRTEFPSINLLHRGRPSRYAYNVTLPGGDLPLFDGLVKYDTQTGQRTVRPWGPGRHGSESPFAPRDGSRGEDDGYVVGFVHDENTGQSECVVLDARDIAGEPVARVLLPQRVPLGFHATWVEASRLRGGAPA